MALTFITMKCLKRLVMEEIKTINTRKGKDQKGPLCSFNIIFEMNKLLLLGLSTALCY